MVPACWLCGSVGPGGLEKGQWPLLALMPDTSIFTQNASGAFQGPIPVLELRGNESE